LKKEILFSFLTYISLSTYTPGPNNITSTSAGMQFGFKKSLPYLAGISTGIFLLRIIAGNFTEFILSMNQYLFLSLKWIGALYIVWLGIAPLIKSRNKKVQFTSNYTYLQGLSLQIVNVKGILNALTVYTLFGSILGGSFGIVFLSAVMLTAIAFTSLALWNFAGASLSRYFENKTFYYVFNSILAVMLIYVAGKIVLI
jgi:cysteine/O-acetylserine efflux protein